MNLCISAFPCASSWAYGNSGTWGQTQYDDAEVSVTHLLVSPVALAPLF